MTLAEREEIIRQNSIQMNINMDMGWDDDESSFKYVPPIEECEDYPRFFAYSDDLMFRFPFSVKAMKRGKYTLSLTANQLVPFDYSKVQRMEIYFTRPSYK